MLWHQNTISRGTNSVMYSSRSICDSKDLAVRQLISDGAENSFPIFEYDTKKRASKRNIVCKSQSEYSEVKLSVLFTDRDPVQH